jgi:hypothetical protein
MWQRNPWAVENFAYHIYMYEERTAKSMPFHNRKQELIFENIIVGFIQNYLSERII